MKLQRRRHLLQDVTDSQLAVDPVILHWVHPRRSYLECDTLQSCCFSSCREDALFVCMASAELWYAAFIDFLLTSGLIAFRCRIERRLANFLDRTSGQRNFSPSCSLLTPFVS
jgi:hypothetical protein